MSPLVTSFCGALADQDTKKYVLRFMFSGHPGKVEADEPEKVLGLDIGNATRTFNFDTNGHTKAKMGGVEMEVSFTATRGKTKIEFYSISNLDRYCGPCIDDVCVYAVDLRTFTFLLTMRRSSTCCQVTNSGEVEKVVGNFCQPECFEVFFYAKANS